MTKNGNIVISSGKRRIFKDGSVAVFNSEGKCSECCCVPKILGSFITNSANRTWNLTQYQGNDTAPPDSRWRLFETGYRLTYGSGIVDADGKLAGLPDSFTTGYSYNGYMQLEIGCPQPDGTIKWS